MYSPTKDPHWTKSFIILVVGILFVLMSFQMLIPTLLPYIKSLGASGLENGSNYSLFSILAALRHPLIYI
ncbi:hypothetical protein [Rossellomorea sp. BNER]|uniref:hypothetical protein n=1 Tax=Rossellomorea sp. BNER TaxID=2962031 RepID=UPI003AF2CB0B|nr:hypothetical protein [Rossellomorea sp. BNER]